MRRTLVSCAFLALWYAVPPAAGAQELPRRFLLVQPNASTPARLQPRAPLPKRSRLELEALQQNDRAIVKFIEGSGVRSRNGSLVLDPAAARIDRAARSGLTETQIREQLEWLKDLIRRTGTVIQPLFAQDDGKLAAEQERAERQSGQELADLNLYYELRLPDKRKTSILESWMQFSELGIVETLQPKLRTASPAPSDIPPETWPLMANQTYFAPAVSGGIDVTHARQFPGGRGENVRVVDVEQGWDLLHEDFPVIAGLIGVNYFDPTDGYHHGTSVVGVLGAAENYYGMTGISPAALFYLSSNITDAQRNSNLAAAVVAASELARPGGIILIEQSVFCGFSDGGSALFCPAEYDDSVLDAVKIAVAGGRIVVVTAGNSAQNLDHPRFNNRFSRMSPQFSGAIYVGAGHPVSHEPLAFTNYGSRLDLQGWGEGVATLGYGALRTFGNDVHQTYTHTFNGTSAAGPIVAGAAAIMQGIRNARLLPSLTSTQMRAALLAGATPQGPGVPIGPLPDLQDSINAIPVPAPAALTATATASNTVLVTWTAAAGADRYEVSRRDSHAGSWQPVGTTTATQMTESGLAPEATYVYRVRAVDVAGNTSADSNYELATTILFTDPQLQPGITAVRAVHLVELRRAVNAVCSYAGALCAAPPFSGSALDVPYVRTQNISASHLAGVRNSLISLRQAIGVSPAAFQEIPAPAMTIKASHIDDLRRGVR